MYRSPANRLDPGANLTLARVVSYALRMEVGHTEPGRQVCAEIRHPGRLHLDGLPSVFFGILRWIIVVFLVKNDLLAARERAAYPAVDVVRLYLDERSDLRDVRGGNEAPLQLPAGSIVVVDVDVAHHLALRGPQRDVLDWLLCPRCVRRRPRDFAYLQFVGQVAWRPVVIGKSRRVLAINASLAASLGYNPVNLDVWTDSIYPRSDRERTARSWSPGCRIQRSAWVSWRPQTNAPWNRRRGAASCARKRRDAEESQPR
jgi:hypothetical protein